MYNYTTRYIIFTSLIISFCIFLILNFCSHYFNKFNCFKDDKEFSSNNNNIKIISNEFNNVDWYLEIPSIYLKAQISEGTSKEVMDDYIGHFEETPTMIGNVALAAHNRGYKNNYFKDLKKVKIGDEILYTYDGNVRRYIVEKHIIIKDTDLECLENTEDNTITLITCVENEPEYRRCIKGIEEVRKEE